MKQKLECSALYSYDTTSKGKLFAKGTKIRKSALYVNAKNKIDAINQLMKKTHQDTFNLNELHWLNELEEKGYINISDDVEDTLDTMTDLQYNYYCECVYEI